MNQESLTEGQIRYSGTNFSEVKKFMEWAEKRSPLFLDRVFITDATLHIEYHYTGSGIISVEMERGDILTLMKDGKFRQDLGAVELHSYGQSHAA